MSLQRLVLVINASYEPITICSARRAVTLVMKGAAVVEQPSAYSIKTPAITVQVPSVIRLRVYRRLPRMNRSVSRKGILLRDRNSCQYCGGVFDSSDLTLDHVLPKSRGGESVWENLVASCFSCNNRKGDRTPEEAVMPLLHRPCRIGFHSKHRLMAGGREHEWDKYLFC